MDFIIVEGENDPIEGLAKGALTSKRETSKVSTMSFHEVIWFDNWLGMNSTYVCWCLFIDDRCEYALFFDTLRDWESKNEIVDLYLRIKRKDHMYYTLG